MIARIWKEDAKGRMIPGTLRVIDVPMGGAPDDADPLYGHQTKRELRPYAEQAAPIHVAVKRRAKPYTRKLGNA